MKKSRRDFIKIASVAGAGLVTSRLKSAGTPEDKIKFISPIDGDMLCDYDGTVENGSFITPVKILSQAGSGLKVNGIKAKYSDGLFLADVPLKNYSNKIEVTDDKTNQKQNITVYRLKNYVNRYRLSLDDNILFLKDISVNSDKYKSIFENEYLGFLKKVHDTYGTKIHLNIYNQTEGFNLSQMTTKFKNEWIQNSGWLHLSFHALQNDPDNPYINAGYDEVKKDCLWGIGQISRFAGEQMMDHVTTLHWGAATLEGTRALRDCGYTCLAGYFNIAPDESPVSYYLNPDQRRHLNEKYIWRDNSEGIIFSRIAIVINNHSLDKISPYLDTLRSGSHKPVYADLMIHEQYFHPSYKDYQPDYRQKVMTAVKWASDNGYKPAFLSECVFD